MRVHEANRGRTARWALALALLAAGAAEAQDGANENAGEEPVVATECVIHSSIRRTQILDNRNVAFFMRDGQIYKNELVRECPTLRPGRILHYTIANNRVCYGDQAQVMWEASNYNFIPTGTCTLGTFVPVTQAQLRDLAELTGAEERRPKRRRRQREPDTTEAVELPPSE